MIVFQFHKGSINTSQRSEAHQQAHSFNSIKVRLILKIIIKVIIYALFQFHKGSINTPSHASC